jgi:AraC-like DNA-binding protein
MMFSYFVHMLMDLKLDGSLLGLIYLVDASLNPPLLGAHHHEEWELNLVVKGRVTYLVNGQRWTIGRRSMMWFFPGQHHQLLHRTADARYYVAAVKRALINDLDVNGPYSELIKETPPKFQTSIIDPGSFDLLCRHLQALTEDGPAASDLNRELGFGFCSSFRYTHSDPERLNSGLQFLLLAAWRQHRLGMSTTSMNLHPAVQRTLNLLEDHTEAVDLERLATDGGISQAYLSRLFHRQVGMPMHQYRATRRLQRFWHVWTKTPRPRMLDAALTAGFGSYAQFHRTFVEVHGCGPRQYLTTQTTGKYQIEKAE